MHNAIRFTVGALAVVVLATPSLRSYDERNDNNNGNRTIDMVDDCDPNDPGWTPTGGCLLKRGDVTLAEFNRFLRSPLYDNIPPPLSEPGFFLVGHPSWRNEPSHVMVEAGKKVRVRNVGGRVHTFTAVQEFGGGVVPPLNVGTQRAPECALAVRIAPGDGTTMIAGGEGIQRFQCCIHPWMRATVRVVNDNN